jgi:hypothetical protein
LPSREIYTQSLEEEEDGFSTCTYTKAKAYCPIGLLQKMMQKLEIRNIKAETLGYVPHVYNNVPTIQEVHRNRNAPCDYTYTGSRKQGSFT